MKPTFSEFQFTYGLTRELEGPRPGLGLIDLPRIPTQNQEAEIPADLISTIRTGKTQLAPLFIQYKRPEKMIRSNAGEWKGLRDDYGVNLSDGYFRFRPYLGDNNQHNKLVKLGRQLPLTFYASPMFIHHDEYRRHAINEDLYENTAFIQAGSLETIDHEDHYITYTSSTTRGIMFSEPLTFPVRSGVEGAFFPDEIQSSLSSFEDLQRDFEHLRTSIAYGFDEEDRRISEHLEPDRYDGEDPAVWFEQQQQFFANSINADLLFFAQDQD